MAGSLAKLAALPPATRVYCGHEYTVSNLKFCAHVEPENGDTAARLAAVTAAAAAGAPTVPSTLADELKTNVFLRTHAPAVQRFTHGGGVDGEGEGGGAAAAAPSPVEVLARLREAKNAFKPPA
jgi:hydroxyacylglutathione hydrolase